MLLTPRGPARRIFRLFWRATSGQPWAAFRRNQNDETHLSTEQSAPQADSWFPGSHGDQERSAGAVPPACQGPRPPVRLTPGLRATIERPPPVALAVRPQGFCPAQRLRTPAEFTRVFKSGRRCGDGCFLVIAAPAQGPQPRLGLAVSRKVSKRAVQRNRIKRLVRESFRKHSADLPSLDIVVMARSGAAACDNQRLTASIDALLERTGRICADSRSS